MYRPIREPRLAQRHFFGLILRSSRASGFAASTYPSGGLDKRLRTVRIFLIYRLLMQTACEHTRTQVLARRDGVDYVECLDCRQIFEAEDLEPVKTEEEEE